MSQGMPDRTLRLLAGPPLARTAWQLWTSLVEAGASREEIDQARAEFAATLRRYGR